MKNTINNKPEFKTFFKLFLLYFLSSGFNYFNPGQLFPRQTIMHPQLEMLS